MVKLGGTAGFSYPALLGVLLALGLLGQTAIYSSGAKVRRELDMRVAASGDEFVRALESYRAALPDTPALPQSIDQLLMDTREGRRRHLRRELDTPFEGSQWQVIRAGNAINGIVLRSDRRPARQAFLAPDGRKRQIETYADWEFLVGPLAEGDG